MAPSTTVLEAKLRSAVEEVYADEETRETLTVRLIRDKVEDELDLQKGFFVTPEWKDKSKELIKTWATKLIDEGEAAPQESIEIETKAPKKVVEPVEKSNTQIKKGTKRGSEEEKPRPSKRQKKAATPSDPSEEEPSEPPSSDESEVSDFEESDSSEVPQRKRQSKSKSKTPVRRGSKKKVVPDDSEDEDGSNAALSDEEEESDALSTPPKKLTTAKKGGNDTAVKRRNKTLVVESDEESEADISPPGELSQDEPKPLTKASPEKKPTPKKAKEDAETSANDSDSSEMSVLLDPSPKPKQKRRSKSEMASRSSRPTKAPKAPKAPKAAKAKVAKDITPIEAEIKTLQSQLVKCGLRKIWGFELKQYGDDGKAKIRHLKGMLRDVGMDGRFSESRAREIKELRELQADVEAVTEGDSKWGLESGRRHRGPRKSFKEPSDEDEDAEGSGGEGKSSKSRSASANAGNAAKRRQEFAFLGDDDESDSE